MRITLFDIAREAGVSTATVDRVMNRREGVTERTRHRVMATASRLGYLDPGPAPEVGPIAVDIVLPGGTNSFIALLKAHFEDLARWRADAAIRVRSIDGFDPARLAAALESLQGRTGAVAVVALDHPAVREAIRGLVASGVPVLTLVSDIPNVPRFGYVGIDNHVAGRLAGHLLGRFTGGSTGSVALFAGSLAYRGHGEREMGFRHMLAEDYRHLAILDLREVQDDTERSYAEARAVLAQRDDLVGIYNIGAGNRGIARALEEAGRAQAVVFIGHELTPHTRRFLVSGTMDAVIDQNPRVEARDAVDRLVHAARNTTPPRLPPVRIQAIFRENIPEA
jgi:LacI family transcriptional regulator